MFGELIPVGGGDPIPLLKKSLLVGRRESCDIVLRFSNVSAHHCQLTVNGGYWYIKDLGSRNGVKVNEVRVVEKRLDPGDQLSVAKHHYVVQYSPVDMGAIGPPPIDEPPPVNVFGKSLLERAGLTGKDSKGPSSKSQPSDGQRKRFDVLNNDPGQIRNPNKPL
jgi:pSer/pThr/pTyr-binding forkhead associated (FHA) protein